MKRGIFGFIFGKRGIIWDQLVPWILAILVLVIVLIIYGVISGRFESLGKYLEEVLKLR